MSVCAWTLLFSIFQALVTADPLPIAMFSTIRRTEIAAVEGQEAFSIDTFYPKSNFTTYGVDGPSVGAENSFANTSVEYAARTFLVSSGIVEADYNFTNLHFDSGFTRGDMGYAYFSQLRNNSTLAEAFDLSMPDSDAKPHVEVAEGKLNTTTTGSYTLEPRVWLTQSNATYVESRAVYLVEPLENRETGSLFSAYIDGASGALIGITDYVSHLPLMAVPATKESLDKGIETFANTSTVADSDGSPLDWTRYKAFFSTGATAGNNVVVMVNGTAVEDTSLEVNGTYDASQPLDSPINQKAAAANTLYVMNVMHDMTYLYGFTENAFNFQHRNLEEGTVSGDDDDLLVFIHDTRVGSPQFMTPPDGKSPQCYIPVRSPSSEGASDGRDAAIDNTILIHEYAHGVTNRLVGGGTARCLQTFEATGLGEGFSDAMADWMAQDAAVTRDFIVGAYFINSASGMRKYPYSTNSTINPLKYSDIGNSSITVTENDIGEIWANILHNVYAALVEEFHFNPDKFRASDATEGNVVFMRIFMDALSLLPCNPTVLQARDAWIQADMTRYGGTHVCTMYKAFASRGLGVGADEATYTGDDKVLDNCNA